MALSELRNAEGSLNRHRSLSCSSPIRNRIIYQEIYSLGGNALLRSYSCDQVLNIDESGRTYQTTQIQLSSFITPEKTVTARPVDRETKEPRKLSLPPPVDKPVIKKPKKKTRKKFNIVIEKLKRTMIYTILTVASSWALYFYLNYRECTYVWDLEKTETDLKTNIFGQEQALTKINSALKTCNSVKGVHVVVFTGGVGVGKTYASSIISRNFPWSSYKLITHSEHFPEDMDKLYQEKFSNCGCNLIILEELSANTAREVISHTVLLGKKRKVDENLLILLIFEVHSETERNEIINEFKNNYVSFYYAPFKTLTEDVVEKCYKVEMQRQKVEVSNSDLKKLVEDKMKPIDIIKGPSGCKGVSDEIASFAIKY